MLGGVCIVGVRFPVCPAAMVPVGRLMFGAGLWTIFQGDQEAGLGMGFWARFGEAIEGVEGFVVTYPVGDGTQSLPHLAVSCGACQLSVIIQSTAIKLGDGGATARHAGDGASEDTGAGWGSPGGPDQTVGAG